MAYTKEKQEEQKGIQWKKYLPWLILCITYILSVLFVWKYGRTHLDSDMASEMVLANQLNEEGTVLSKNWWYSTELRVICEQLLFKVGLWIFPHKWLAARTFAQAVQIAILVVTYLYLANGLKMKSKGVYGAIALTCPFGAWYLFHGIFGGFYFTHMILILFSLGLCARLIRNEEKGGAITFWRIFVLLCTCFLAGLNGIRILMNLYVPLMAAALVIFLWKLYETEGKCTLRSKECKLLTFSFLSLIASASGYLVNSKILEPRYHFTSYGERMWSSLDLNRLVKAWSDFLSLFGYQADGVMGYEKVFSLSGILCVCGIILIGVIIFTTVRMVSCRKALSFEKRALIMIFLTCLLIAGMAFAFMDDMQNVNASYWLPIVPLAWIVVEIWLEEENFRFPAARRFAIICLACCIAGSSVATVRHFLKQPKRAKPGMEQVTEWLVASDFTEGYASFWNSNIVTELSDGKIEMWTVGTDFSIYQWLQSTSHTEAPQEKEVFLLMSRGEDYTKFYNGENIVYQDENGYTVLVFADAQELMQYVK